MTLPPIRRIALALLVVVSSVTAFTGGAAASGSDCDEEYPGIQNSICEAVETAADSYQDAGGSGDEAIDAAAGLFGAGGGGGGNAFDAVE